jgi:CheY-like chemotaxis protein
MTLVVVVDDSAEIRNLMSFVLLKDGHEVLVARDGVAGLALVTQHKPDLVVSDVQMPGMSGFELLVALRRDAAIATTPVILLTALKERADVREGMNAGADDYLTKPFTPKELSDAVAAQLAKRVVRDSVQNQTILRQLALQKDRVAKDYERRLAQELAQRWPTTGGAADDERLEHATALFIDIVDYAALAEKLSGAELSEMVKRFYSSVGDTMYLFGVRHMHFVGEGLLALFAEDNDTRSVSHGQRALRAALGLQNTASAMRRFLEVQYPDRELPPFQATAGLHSGPVTLARLQDPIRGTVAQTLPVGQVVGIALRLQQLAATLHWGIVASQPALEGMAGIASVGSRAVVDLPGRTEGMPVCEVLAIKAS